MPNIQGIRNINWNTYITSVDAVEALTGYDFFTNLPEPIERCVESGINGNNPPLDTDADGVPNATDNCTFDPNPDQIDTDNDGQGNACDADDDNDGVPDTEDAFPLDPNESVDTDGDGIGNNADTDDDDGKTDAHEIACGSNPLDADSKAVDTDGDGLPNCVDPDDDNDGVLDGADNCPLTANPNQADFDGDGIGDTCDTRLSSAGAHQWQPKQKTPATEWEARIDALFGEQAVERDETTDRRPSRNGRGPHQHRQQLAERHNPVFALEHRRTIYQPRDLVSHKKDALETRSLKGVCDSSLSISDPGHS